MKRIAQLLAVTLMAACAAQAPQNKPEQDLGQLWVKHAAEYRAITRQVYVSATEALPRFIEDLTWSALPEQKDAEHLPPAVILDVDETVVSNVDFQLTFERPFANWKLEEWTSNSKATPIDGVKAFVEHARRLGVTTFFVTNRPCEPKDGSDASCPQKQSTIDDIAEVGIQTDADHVFLSQEQGWNREKLSRRLHIAKTHRVVMLIGDDFGDFVPCARDKVVDPCTASGTKASRSTALNTYDSYWGNGWYILPNPMHGSWTSAQ